MRSRIRIILVGGLAVLALSGIASASASAALPELVNGEGNALVKDHFTGKGGKFKIIIANWGALACEEGSSGSGEVTGLKSFHQSLSWKGCQLVCKTSGAKKNEIQIPEVNGTLVYRVYHGEPGAAAILYSLPKELKIECGSGRMNITGSWLVPVVLSTLETTLWVESTSEESSKDVQYEEAAGGEVKTAGLWVETKGVVKEGKHMSAGLEYTEKDTFEEAAKINK